MTVIQENQTTKKVEAIQTAQTTNDRLTKKEELTLLSNHVEETQSISVDSSKSFQTIEGFGGAFTEAAAVTLHKLPVDKQEEVLRAYFDGTNGIGYTFCRTHIGSCDFSFGNYSYDEVENDTELTHFTVERDHRDLIPMIKDALQIAKGSIRLLASPWSPPAWMKTNGKMTYGGKLKPEYRQTWANYYCRYYREYEKENIPIWGFTVQNELEATQTWESCLYSPEEERDFVRDYLGPTLRTNGLGNLSILIFDHNRDHIFDHANVVFSDSKAAEYIWGTAFHWYVGDWFDNVQKLHDAYPDKKLLFTEGSQEGGPHLGEWAVGERYARSIINDLNRWTVGWIDWNMLLDEMGGPNHVGNYCHAAIMVDTKSQEVLYQSSYYYIGHFTRYIKPGAQRIRCDVHSDALEATAFRNPDGKIAVVVLNSTSQTQSFSLKYEGLSCKIESLPHSIATFIFA